MGIDYNADNNDETRFLILDPHYTGVDNLKNIIDKGGISWKKSDMFLDSAFYNFCLPIRQKMI